MIPGYKALVCTPTQSDMQRLMDWSKENLGDYIPTSVFGRYEEDTVVSIMYNDGSEPGNRRVAVTGYCSKRWYKHEYRYHNDKIPQFNFCTVDEFFDLFYSDGELICDTKIENETLLSLL